MTKMKTPWRNDRPTVGKCLMFAVLPAVALWAVSPAMAAEPAFPVTLTQPDRANAKCFVLIEPVDGVPSVMRYLTDVSPEALVVTLPRAEDTSLQITYDRDAEGALKPTPRVGLSGGELDAKTDVKADMGRKMAEGMLGGMIEAMMPASTIFPLFQSIKAGDKVYADDYATATADVLSLTYLDDAERTSFQNGVTARSVGMVAGRLTLFAEGEFSADYKTPVGTAHVSHAGTFEVDVATGLVRASRVVSKVTRGGVVAHEDVATEYCEISGPSHMPPVPAPAAVCGDIPARLEALETLLKGGLVTEAEAAEKRATILKSL